MASLIRSNGVLLIIHIGYPLFQKFLTDLDSFWKNKNKKILFSCLKEILWAIFIVLVIIFG